MTGFIQSFGKQRNRGYVLITTVVVVILLMMMGTYYLFFVMTEYKIAKSQSSGIQGYYLAEAGVHDAIWRLKNVPEWTNSFETNPTWSAEFTRTNELIPGGSYTVKIQNTALAEGEITATGSLTVGPYVSHRVIKTTVFKAPNDNPIGDKAIYDNGDIKFTGSRVNILNGFLFSNINILIQGSSTVSVTKKTQSVNHVDVQSGSTLTTEAIEDMDNPPRPDPLPQPAVDFDSADADSYKTRANQTYTASQFAALLSVNPNLTLNGISYVTGSIDIKRGQNLTVNGALVADDSIDIGTASNPHSGLAKLTINRTAGQPAGLLSKKKINIGQYTDVIAIQGLVYGSDEINITSLPASFSVVGGVYSRKLWITSCWTPINITYDESTVLEALGTPRFSPVIIIDHWEEEY